MAEVNGRFLARVALVTGAARGIGKQNALDLAAEGAFVALIDIDEPPMTEIQREIEKKNGRCLVRKCDITDPEQVNDLVRHVVATAGSIHILVNNAGYLPVGGIEDLDEKTMASTLAINVKGVLYCIRAVTPIMKANRYGKIVNVASITGKNGDNSSSPVYGASKGAVITLTRSIARELGPFGINCNGVAPHAVMTDMMSYWDEARKQKAADAIPLRRLGTVEDISRLMLFLAADESSFITGETININGGYYMD
jgi:3-oxoacyl-[acyl-carrier protein] reductase